MAVTSTKVDTDLVLVYSKGVKPNGKEDLKVLRLSKIKTSAADEAMYAIGDKIANVLDYEVKDIHREDGCVLLSE